MAGLEGRASEETQQARYEDSLVESFAGTFDEIAIRALYAEVKKDFDGATVRIFVPLLTERIARETLARQIA